MLEIHKNLLLDENQQPVAVQIPIHEFRLIDEVLENYGLSKMINETKDDKRLSGEEASFLLYKIKEWIRELNIQPVF